MNVEIKIYKNKYGYYKLQRWQPPFKLWHIFRFKGLWVDAHFQRESGKCVIYHTFEEAQGKKDDMLRELEKNDDSWECYIKE